MTGVLDVFPRRPLRLWSYGTSLRPNFWQVLVGAMLAGLLYIDVLDYTPDLIDELRLQGATPAAQAGIADGGKCETNRGLTTCDFKALYRTADGVDLEKRLHYATFSQDVPDKSPFLVRYDPRSPRHIATSWGRHMLINRLITQLLAFALAGLMIWAVAHEYAWRFRVRKSLGLAAAAPLPIVARFVKVATTQGHADVRFKWTYPATGIEHADRTRFAKGMQPFWLDETKTQMLALAGPDGHAHLLDADLRTTDLSEPERRDLIRFRAQTNKV